MVLSAGIVFKIAIITSFLNSVFKEGKFRKRKIRKLEKKFEKNYNFEKKIFMWFYLREWCLKLL